MTISAAALWLLTLAAKASVPILLAGVLSLLPRTSAAFRHLLWTLAIAGALLLPLLGPLLPAWPVESPVLFQGLRVPQPAEPTLEPRTPQSAPTAVPGAVPATGRGTRSPAPGTLAAPGPETPPTPIRTSTLHWSHWILVAWAAGGASLLLAALLGSLRLSRLARVGDEAEEEWEELAGSVAAELGLRPGGYRLRRSGQALSPMTWGWRHPVVLLPDVCDSWSADQRREVLVHELSHIRRGDCVTQGLANLACILYWFHPLVWLAARRMLVERERACDDQVLRSGAKASSYAGNLLEMARSVGADSRTAQLSPAMARRSQISGRLLAVLDPDLARSAPSRSGVALAGVALLVLTLPLAALAPAPVAAEPSAGQLEVSAAGQIRTDARAEIAAVQAEYRAAFQRGDAGAIAALYTRDAELMALGAGRVFGRPAIERYLAGIMGVGFTDLVVDSRELYPVGELMCEIGWFRVDHPTPVLVVENRFMTLWRLEPEGWRIHRDIGVP